MLSPAAGMGYAADDAVAVTATVLLTSPPALSTFSSRSATVAVPVSLTPIVIDAASWTVKWFVKIKADGASASWTGISSGVTAVMTAISVSDPPASCP